MSADYRGDKAHYYGRHLGHDPAQRRELQAGQQFSTASGVRLTGERQGGAAMGMHSPGSRSAQGGLEQEQLRLLGEVDRAFTAKISQDAFFIGFYY